MKVFNSLFQMKSLFVVMMLIGYGLVSIPETRSQERQSPMDQVENDIKECSQFYEVKGIIQSLLSEEDASKAELRQYDEFLYDWRLTEKQNVKPTIEQEKMCRNLLKGFFYGSLTTSFVQSMGDSFGEALNKVYDEMLNPEPDSSN